MEKIRVAVPSGKQCYQLTTDDGNKYFYGDNGELEGNVFVASINPLEVVGEATKETLGLVNGTGNIIIPFNKKNIERIKGTEYYLVSESNITDFKVKEALSKKNDPGFKLQDSSSDDEKSIKEQMLAEMSRDGKDASVLFGDIYSQVCLYDLMGSKIDGTDSSFIGKNDIAIYFHDNVKGTSSNRMKVEMKTEEVKEEDTKEEVTASVQTPDAPSNTNFVANNSTILPDTADTSTSTENISSIPDAINQNPTETLDASFDPAIAINNEPATISNEIDKVEEITAPQDIPVTLDSVSMDEPSVESDVNISVPEEINIPEEELFKEPEKPDELINEAIGKFEESYTIVEDLKKVISNKDEKYDDMVSDYEKQLARKEEDHKHEVEELNMRYDTDVAKLKNHGANWQNRYQRANARADVLDEEGRKKSETIEKLRSQLRDSYEEVSALKETKSNLTDKLENTKSELELEKEAHTRETERADNLQDENNRLVAGRSKLLENMRDMTKQIRSVESLVKDVKTEPTVENNINDIEYDFDDEPKKDIVDFSLGESLKDGSLSFDNLDDIYTYKKAA